VAEKQRSVSVKVRFDKEGQLEVFRQMAEEAGDFGEAANRAGTLAEKAMGEIERRGTVSVRTLANLRLAVDDYTEALQRAEEEGREVGENERANLAALEQAYQKAADRAGEFGVAQWKAKEAIDGATEAAGGAGPRISSLGDVMGEITKEIGPGAVKWASWGAAAAGAFTAGYAAGTKFREVMNDLTGGDFDRIVQNFQAFGVSMADIAESMVGAADSSKLLENQLNILRNKGIDPTGMSAQEVAAAVDELGLAMQRGAMEAGAAAEAYQKWKEGLGLDKEKLDEAAAQLAEFIKKFAAENEQLSQEELAKLFAPDVDKIRKQYERLGEEVQPELEGIVEDWRMVGIAIDDVTGKTESAAQTQAQSLDSIKESLAEFRGMWEEIPAKLAAAAQAAGEFVAPWEMASTIFNGATSAMAEATDGAAHLAATMQALAQNAETSNALTEALKKMRDAIDGVKNSADAAAASVGRVLTPAAADDPYGSVITRQENRGYGDF
jgi:hypothetical protein